ncbi:MAG TPA: MFS transporter [Methanomassiliicoccales archaeon]|nr:MFS transporter [Methanomassiliicoccales archaeon]
MEPLDHIRRHGPHLSTGVLPPGIAGGIGNDLQESFGVSLTAVALLGSAYCYAYMVMQLPCGALTDRWGPRRTVCALTALSALGAFVTALAISF